VLRRLSEELFALVFPALSTWKLLKDCMAFEGSSWHEVWSEDLPSGLSDRADGDNSSDDTSSISGSSRGDGLEKL
jgi:hypothetical protein